jgi:transcriptional regulator with XRE-family HTH domain
MKRKTQFGEMVRSYRKSLGLTQQALASQLGVETGHIGSIERGHRKPSLKLIGRLADILGFDRQNLLILAHPNPCSSGIAGAYRRDKAGAKAQDLSVMATVH